MSVSGKLKQFYDECVKLKEDDYENLVDKKDLNVTRLEDGLEKYCKENDVNYLIVDFEIQGSVAMKTAIQDEDKDFDIDVGIIFDSETLGDIGHRKIKDVVVECFKNKWPDSFNSEPEAKKNCVRISYKEGYHLDFAIYKKVDLYNGLFVDYYHAGSTQWNNRNPFAINEWFQKQIENYGENLRIVICLSKQLVKKSCYERVVGSLVQTVLIVNNYYNASDLALTLEKTFENISNYLKYNDCVSNPTDSSLELIVTDEHKAQLSNYKNCLDKVLSKLHDIDLYVEENDKDNRILNEIFDTEYFGAEINENYSFHNKASLVTYENNANERFIEDMCKVNIVNEMLIKCEIGFDGYNKKSLPIIHARYKGVPIGPKIHCTAICPFKYDKLLWKVRNRGINALTPEKIRGSIEEREGIDHIVETSDFSGNHYIECYALKNGVCIAAKRINIKIINKIVHRGDL